MITASDTAGPAVGPDTDPVLSARGLVKRYGNVTAIRGSDFDLFPGEVLAIVGDNGAGKSSLIKALTGALIPDSGTITLNGEEIRFGSPAGARNRGIETVYQTLAVARTRHRDESVSRPRNPSLRPARAAAHPRPQRHANPGKGTTRRARYRHHSGHHSAGGESFRWPATSRRRRTCRDVRKNARDHGRTDRRARRQGNRTRLGTDQTHPRQGHTGHPDQSRHARHFEVADRIHIHRLGRRTGVVDPKQVTMSDTVAFITGASEIPSTPTQQQQQ
jgi:fructose transport system ATP-binding protein